MVPFRKKHPNRTDDTLHHRKIEKVPGPTLIFEGSFGLGERDPKKKKKKIMRFKTSILGLSKTTGIVRNGRNTLDNHHSAELLLDDPVALITPEERFS